MKVIYRTRERALEKLKRTNLPQLYLKGDEVWRISYLKMGNDKHVWDRSDNLRFDYEETEEGRPAVPAGVVPATSKGRST